MKTILAILTTASLASCSMPSGRGEVTVAWDNQKSFADFGLMATAVAGSLASASVSKAKEVTTQKANAGKTAEVLGAQKADVAKTGIITNAKGKAVETAAGAGAKFGEVQVTAP